MLGHFRLLGFCPSLAISCRAVEGRCGGGDFPRTSHHDHMEACKDVRGWNWSLDPLLLGPQTDAGFEGWVTGGHGPVPRQLFCLKHIRQWHSSARMKDNPPNSNLVRVRSSQSYDKDLSCPIRRKSILLFSKAKLKYNSYNVIL